MTNPSTDQNKHADPFVTIRVCHEMTEAQVLRGLLEQNGIPTIIDNEHMGSAIPFMSSALTLPVKVRIEDEQQANFLLDNVQPLAGNRPYFTLDLDECPACGSSRILQYSKFLPWLFGFNKPDIEGQYHRCMACGNRWRAEGSRNENQMLVALFGSMAAFGIVWLLIYIIGWLQYNL